MVTNSPRKIEAVRSTFRIVDVLRETGGAGVTEIASELEVAKSGVYRHLTTLRAEGYVLKENNVYRLSLKFLEVSEQVKNSLIDHKVVKSELGSLADETSEVINYGVHERGHVVYVAKERGDSAVETVSEVGKRMPLNSTAMGKAMMVKMPRHRVDEIIEKYGLPGRTAATITDPDVLHEELDTIGQRGYAIDDEETLQGVRCISMAVTGVDNRIMGAVSITGPSKRMTDERMEHELGDKLAEVTNVIELNSRYS